MRVGLAIHSAVLCKLLNYNYLALSKIAYMTILENISMLVLN